MMGVMGWVVVGGRVWSGMKGRRRGRGRGGGHVAERQVNHRIWFQCLAMSGEI